MADLDKMNAIADAVGAYQGVSLKDIRSRSRKRPLVDARRYITYFALKHTRATHQEIGNYLGSNRGHDDVYHYRKSLSDLIETDSEIRDRVNFLAKCVGPILEYYDVNTFLSKVGNFMITDQ